METPKVTERSFYRPIADCLEEVGFKGAVELKLGSRYLDILFYCDDVPFIAEVKIGTPEEVGLSAVAQAHDYAKKIGTSNIIIIILPEESRQIAPSKVTVTARRIEIDALILTDCWTKKIERTTITKVFDELYERIQRRETLVDFRSIVKLIERYVKDLHSVIVQIRTDELITEVV